MWVGNIGTYSYYKILNLNLFMSIISLVYLNICIVQNVALIMIAMYNNSSVCLALI